MTQKLSNKETQRLIQLARKTQWDYKLSQYENKALKGIDKSVRKTQAIISKKLGTIKPTSVFSVQRMNTLANEMEALTKGIQAQIAADIARTTEIAGKASYIEHNKIASFNGLVPDFNHVALSAAQMKSLVTGTKVGGKKLNEWVSHNFSKRLQADFKSKITAGMLMGQGYPEMIKQFNSGVYDQFKGDMEGLTRTYVQSINVNAMHDVAKANDDIIKGWKWNSVAENRTCIRCLSLDSRDKIYEIDEGPVMPLHVRCRCFPEYVTKTFREMGVDVDEIKDQFRPYTIRGSIEPVTGKIKPGKIGVGGGKFISTGRFLGTYEDYFNGVSPAVKLQILGPTRYELWKSGKVSLSNMASKGGDIHLIKDLVKTKKVVKSSFVPAKTIQEAEEFVRKNLGIKKVSYAKDADIDFINTINKQLDKLKIDYPKTIASIKKLDATGQLGYTASMEVTPLMLKEGGGSELLISKMVASNLKESNAFYAKLHKTGNFATSGVNGAIDHEVGHVVRNKLRELDIDGSFDFIKKLGAMDKKTFPSIYAEKNRSETFAECFSELVGKAKKDWSESTTVLSKYLSTFKGEL